MSNTPHDASRLQADLAQMRVALRAVEASEVDEAALRARFRDVQQQRAQNALATQRAKRSRRFPLAAAAQDVAGFTLVKPGADKALASRLLAKYGKRGEKRLGRAALGLDEETFKALDRDEEFVTITRHAATVRVRLGATRDGRFVAKRVWCWVNTGAYADCGPGVAMKMGYAGVGPNFIPAVVGSGIIVLGLWLAYEAFSGGWRGAAR